MSRHSSNPIASIKCFEKPKLRDAPDGDKKMMMSALTFKITQLLASLGIKKDSDDFSMTLTYLQDALVVQRAGRMSFSSMLLFLHMVMNGIKPFNFKLYGMQARDIVLKLEEFIEWQQNNVAESEKQSTMNIQQRTIAIVEAMKQNGGDAKLKALQEKWEQQSKPNKAKNNPYSYFISVQRLNSRFYLKNSMSDEFDDLNDNIKELKVMEKTKKDVEQTLKRFESEIFEESGQQFGDDGFEKSLFDKVQNFKYDEDK